MRKKARRDYFVTVESDGLVTNPIGPWAEDKYRYLGMYAEMFATGMKNRWDRRIYLDLFSGPGYSKLRGTGRVVLGSPMIALSLPDPFDQYVFADENGAALEALKARVARLEQQPSVSYVVGDANAVVAEILEMIPRDVGQKTLSFCFLDPYKLNIHFETVQRIADGRAVDFLILLALYVDANRNVQWYVEESNSTIDLFLGDQTWRTRWRRPEERGETIVTFLAKEYSSRMAQIGYLPMALDDMVKVRTHDRRLPPYYLAFFSRHKTGLKFWREVLKYANDQLDLPL
jgi:three-Cys-motif partner protein